MDDDQQFCLRWNNHQSTLVAVFDTLLENGTLVDCTLAAEGKCLNAHKVVLSACSPYFESLLSRHFDKHPILILKDVKFQELKAMMDYMYRGEVNISQDQLGALLKAAESLQIKGLSDNRKGETERKPAPAPPPPKSPQQTSALPKVQGLTIEQRSRDDSREGSVSPGPRKKKRLRRKSEELDNHDASNSSESHSLPAQNIPSSLPAVSKINADVPEPVETKSEILRHKQPDDIPQVPIIKEKIETHTELMLEPKSEYVEEMNEDSIEDLTLDDDDLSNMEQMDDQAGPSHGNTGEGSSQGFGGWHMGNQSQDEVFLAAQEAVGAHRDSQGPAFKCDPLLAISKIENAAGKTIYSCPKPSSSFPARRRKPTQPFEQNTMPDIKRIPKAKKAIHMMRRKYITEKHQNVLICEKNGKLVATLRCVLCNSFVKRGEQVCSRCKTYLLTGIKPPAQKRVRQSLKCNRCSAVVQKDQKLCVQCETAVESTEAATQRPMKVLASGKWNGNPMSKKKQVAVSKKTLERKRCGSCFKRFVRNEGELCRPCLRNLKRERCVSCCNMFVRVKGDICKRCSNRLAKKPVEENQKEDQLPSVESLLVDVTYESDVMESLNNLENIEIVEEDDDVNFSASLTDVDASDYYVSISDINKMLDGDDVI